MNGLRTFEMASLRLCKPRALPPEMQGDVVELHSLSTPVDYRRMGHASQLMLSVCCEADLARKFLFLCVEPNGVEKQVLLDFYLNFGFVPIQADPLLMVRPFVGVSNGIH